MGYSMLNQRPLFFVCSPVLFIPFFAFACLGHAEEIVNTDRGFSFTIPKDWKKGGPSETDPNLSASIYFPSKELREFLTVDLSEIKEGVEFEFSKPKIPEDVEKEMKQFIPNIVFGKPERTEVGGYPAWKLAGEFKQDHVTSRLKCWIVVYRSQFYFIRWFDTEQVSHPDDVKAVLESFRFINDPLEGTEQENVVLGAVIVASKGWLPVTAKEKGRSGMLLYIPSDGFRETFSLDVVPASVNAKKMFLSDRYLSLLRDSLRATDPSLKMLSGGRLQLDGVKAWQYVTEEKADGKTVHGKYWQVIKNDRVYTMTWKYLDGSTREPQVNRMVQSLHFITPHEGISDR